MALLSTVELPLDAIVFGNNFVRVDLAGALVPAIGLLGLDISFGEPGPEPSGSYDWNALSADPRELDTAASSRGAWSLQRGARGLDAQAGR